MLQLKIVYKTEAKEMLEDCISFFNATRHPDWAIELKAFTVMEDIPDYSIATIETSEVITFYQFGKLVAKFSNGQLINL